MPPYAMYIHGLWCQNWYLDSADTVAASSLYTGLSALLMKISVQKRKEKKSFNIRPSDGRIFVP